MRTNEYKNEYILPGGNIFSQTLKAGKKVLCRLVFGYLYQVS